MTELPDHQAITTTPEASASVEAADHASAPAKAAAAQSLARLSGAEPSAPAAAQAQLLWYAVRVLNNRVFIYEDYLKSLGVNYYLPTEERVTQRPGGVRQKRRWPMIPSLVFVQLEAAQVAEVERRSPVPSFFYRQQGADGRRTPLVIPQRQMEMFILVSSSGEQGLEFFDSSRLDLSVGHRVRVTDGIFRGAVGHIKRIKGNRRFVVTIDGVCCVATHYIPVAFLERLD